MSDTGSPWSHTPPTAAAGPNLVASLRADLAAAIASRDALAEQVEAVRAWANSVKQIAARSDGQGAYAFANGLMDKLLAMTETGDSYPRAIDDESGLEIHTPRVIVAPEVMTAVLELTDGSRITGVVYGNVFMPNVASLASSRETQETGKDDHEHEWVDNTTLSDQELREVCRCGAERRRPRPELHPPRDGAMGWLVNGRYSDTPS